MQIVRLRLLPWGASGEGHEVELCARLVTEGVKSMHADSHDGRGFGEDWLGWRFDNVR